MPVKNSNSKISAHSDLATNLLLILKPNNCIINCPLCQKGQLHFNYVLEDGLLEKYVIINQKSQKFPRNCLSKWRAGRII